VAGKGGVGKTTVSAALARMASGLGLSCLIVEVEGKSSLAAMFARGDHLGYDEEVLLPASNGDGPGNDIGEIRARTLTPDRALVEYLEDHGMGRTSRRLVRSGALDVVSTGAPGIKDILVLGKVKQLEATAAADLIVLDTPASGHAVSFLMSARGLLDAVSVGPIQTQAAGVLELLTDPSRCQVMLVTLPEETPVNEVVETAFALEERVGVDLGPVVVNGLYPPLAGLDADPEQVAVAAGVELGPGETGALRRAAEFRSRRHQLQEEQAVRLAEALPLPQVRLPAVFAADLGPPEIEGLARALRAQVEALQPETAG
jgi:anion-transporting  ArsA/GET3 family ATPase